ncbi:MAG: thrombospondin type 3 repeat-containing protein [Pseudomonadota bacterium]
MLNIYDRCPKIIGDIKNVGCPCLPEPGLDYDGDCLSDQEDKYPKEPGLKENKGLPCASKPDDQDGDCAPDYIDHCLDKPGPIEHMGCPQYTNDKNIKSCEVTLGDVDGDCIADYIDNCLTQAGPEENLGCPIIDNDQDGIRDEYDRCPYVAGLGLDQSVSSEIDNGCPDDDCNGLKNSAINYYDGWEEKISWTASACPKLDTVSICWWSPQYIVDTDCDLVPDEQDRCPNDSADHCLVVKQKLAPTLPAALDLEKKEGVPEKHTPRLIMPWKK